MIKKIKRNIRNTFKKILCKHDFVKITYEEHFDSLRNTRYSYRFYTCTKCGKSCWIDGRFDKYDSN